MRRTVIRPGSPSVRAAFAFVVLFVPLALRAQNTVTYSFPQSFNVSLGSGYSWGITSLHVDPLITGQTTVSNISVSGSASVTGATTGGFDWIVLVGSAPFGFPSSGQVFVNSTTNPFLLSPTAPVEFHFAEQPGGSSVINGSFDFKNDAFSTPCCGVNRLVSDSATPLDLTSGLYVQMLLYTGDPTANMTVSNLQVTLTLTNGCSVLQPPNSSFLVGPAPPSVGGRATGISARFQVSKSAAVPSGLLSDAAAACGYSGFDWQQTITNMPPPYLSDVTGTLQVPPFLDPPVGGYPYFINPAPPRTAQDYLIFVDANPFYYNPALVPIVSGGRTLTFYDRPRDSALPFCFTDCFLGFTTTLVGIRSSTSFDVLHTFTWASNYTGKTGGTLVIESASLPDTFLTAGTGSATLVSIDGVPMTAFGAFSNKLEATSTSFELRSQFTLGSTSDGINPRTEAITLEAGSYLVTIPANSFHPDKKGGYVYEGTIEGESLQLKIVPNTATTYTVKAEGTSATPISLRSPAPIVLRIGNDIGAGTAALDD